MSEIVCGPLAQATIRKAIARARELAAGRPIVMYGRPEDVRLRIGPFLKTLGDEKVFEGVQLFESVNVSRRDIEICGPRLLVLIRLDPGLPPGSTIIDSI